MAQLKSPLPGNSHHAPVRAPLAGPFDVQRIVGAHTRICPVFVCPFAPPKKRTSRSRASLPEALGQGCPSLQVPSISRAAIPASLTLGPSAHQMGPSPSQTRVGVQAKACPDAMTRAVRTASMAGAIVPTPSGFNKELVGDQGQSDHRLPVMSMVISAIGDRVPGP